MSLVYENPMSLLKTAKVFVRDDFMNTNGSQAFIVPGVPGKFLCPVAFYGFPSSNLGLTVPYFAGDQVNLLIDGALDALSYIPLFNLPQSAGMNKGCSGAIYQYGFYDQVLDLGIPLKIQLNAPGGGSIPAGSSEGILFVVSYFEYIPIYSN